VTTYTTYTTLAVPISSPTMARDKFAQQSLGGTLHGMVKKVQPRHQQQDI